MCGLAGIVGPGPVRDLRVDVGAMLRPLRHRGPDGEGFLERSIDGSFIVLGHRRLAIIDLSAAAAQPMTSADGSLHLILNGEIYNYLELRAELERVGRRFRTRSDTEVLLEAWATWGLGALDRVVGMFAFALLDESRRTVTLARDQFAMKPLYYSTGGGRLAFASEIPPLLGLSGVSRAGDPGPIADFLARGVNNHAGRTLFADVQELPGAHVAVIALDAPTVVEPHCYWQPPDRLVHDLPFAAAAHRVGELLEESVRLHLRSDVPVGILLSGGQDSSAVLALTRRIQGADAELHTFSYRGGGGAFDEGPFIDAARDASGAVGHEVILFSEAWATDLPALVASQGEPFGSPVIYAQRRLFQEAAAQGMRVVLDGQGSDEFLAGYDKFRAARLSSLLRPGRLTEFGQAMRGFAGGGTPAGSLARGAARLRWPALQRLRAGVSSPLLDAAWLERSGAALSDPWQPTGPDILRNMLGAELSAPSLPWLMRYADRNAMSFSIENRLPFLNPRLVEFVLGLPEEHFITSDGLGKALLREAMRGLVPDLILRRRARVGFDVPLEAWLTRTPGLVGLIEEASVNPAVDRRHAGRLAGAVRSGQPLPRSYAFEVWRLATLSLWAQTFEVTFR